MTPIKFNYNAILNDKSLLVQSFVYHDGMLFTIDSIDGNNVSLQGTSSISKIDFVSKIKILNHNGNDYVALYYVNTNKIKILYADIEFNTTYYGDIDKWFKTSIPFINDYMKHVIDSKMDEAINNMNLDSSNILSIINKYQLPNSRDLMLVKCIEKYANEMSKLLSDINEPNAKKELKPIISSIKEMFNIKTTTTKDDGPNNNLTTDSDTSKAKKTITRQNNK